MSDIIPDRWGEKPIRWELLAKPQERSYDSQIVLFAAGRNEQYIALRDRPSDFQQGFQILPNTYWDSSKYRPASPDDENVKLGLELLQLWPEGYGQTQLLLDSIHVSRFHQRKDVTWGCSCGPGPNGFGSICVTVDNPVGFAEGIVHEMAHHKLRALSVEIGKADRLIKNDCSFLYRSPIRYDCIRPMTAVVHAQYSYMYISALDIAICEAVGDRELAKRIARLSLSAYLPKLQFGAEVIREHGQYDNDGEEFFEGFFKWYTEIVDDGMKLLRSLQVEMKPFSHPLG